MNWVPTEHNESGPVPFQSYYAKLHVMILPLGAIYMTHKLSMSNTLSVMHFNMF